MHFDEPTRRRVNELQDAINSGPQLRQTLADIDAEFDRRLEHVAALHRKRCELKFRLSGVEEARLELVRIRTQDGSPSSEARSEVSQDPPQDEPQGPPETPAGTPSSESAAIP